LVDADDGQALADADFVEVDLPGRFANDSAPDNSLAKLQADDPGRSIVTDPGHVHDHSHDHPNEHEHQPDHTHAHKHDHLPQHEHPERTLPKILALIENSALTDSVKANASRIFTRLGQAEGRVHGLPADQVHFHEVGSLDAILDIVGACIALELLGIQEIHASALHLGGGFVRTQHGLLPVPAPATAVLLEGVPVYTTEVKGELVTPTGAAILTSLCREFGSMPPIQVERIGYGAGSRERLFPNVLRVFIGESISGANARPIPGSTFNMLPTFQPASQDRRSTRDPYPEQHESAPGAAGYHDGPAVVIEANLDDMTPQLYERLMERLLETGALDVMFIPVQMKKSRPGVLLHVLAHPESLDELLQLIFRESTTLGARTYPVTKHMLQRQLAIVQTPYGPVQVKLAYLGKELANLAPEYEDCRRLAEQHGLPLKEILAAAQSAARQEFSKIV
jgi:hypothetical protein